MLPPKLDVKYVCGLCRRCCLRPFCGRPSRGVSDIKTVPAKRVVRRIRNLNLLLPLLRACRGPRT